MTDDARNEGRPEARNEPRSDARPEPRSDARPDARPDTKVLAGTDGVTRATALPPHFPPWAGKLAELYFSGTTSMFVIHGNTFDVVRAGGDEPRWVGLADFLAEQLFGRWDLVIHYDLARGLRCAAGSSSQRLQQMVELANQLARRPARPAPRSDQGRSPRSTSWSRRT